MTAGARQVEYERALRERLVISAWAGASDFEPCHNCGASPIIRGNRYVLCERCGWSFSDRTERRTRYFGDGRSVSEFRLTG